MKTEEERLTRINGVQQHVKLVTDQLAYYRSLPVPLNDNLLHWWQNKLSSLSSLATLARQRLGVAGTSVPSERFFSAAGNLVTPKRACLASRIWIRSFF